MIYSNQAITKKLARRKVISKILSWVLHVFAAIIFVCAVCLAYQKIIKKQSNVNLFGYMGYMVVSGSMKPSINVGDVIIVKQTTKNLEVGNIITFLDDSNNVVTHRIVNIVLKDNKTFYQTKGDNNNSSDVGLVPPQNILGKYCFKISYLGSVVIAILSPVGMVVLGIVIITTFLISNKLYRRKIARHALREKYKKQNIV